MRTVRLLVVSMVFAAVFAVSALAQSASGKVGLINTYAFADTKGGITKYVAQLNKLSAEFKPDETKLNNLVKQLQALEKEIQNLQKQMQVKGSPISAKTVQPKVDRYNKLKRDFKFQQEDVQARVESRRKVLVNPILSDIMKSMQAFAKQKGYSVILDGAKLQESGILMAFDQKTDVTKEFIAYYNARPAGTATK
ncbi:MAG: OmpH family outer membrane protein [Pyrinomonadaceae bacterium]|nr:OmpH family outer membrane protein [Pyrinomonadaceae bacterium]